MEPIEWRFPTTTEAALADLAVPGTGAVAGGTTLLDLLKLGIGGGRRLVDLTRLDLRDIEARDGTVFIGALASNSAVARSPLVRAGHPALSEAILMGASEQIRNAASIGGNLMQASRCTYFRAPDLPCNRRRPSSGCPAIATPLAGHAVLGTSTDCIAAHPSDMAVALLALDARISWKGREGDGAFAMDRFYRLPRGAPHLQTRLPEGALITGVELPESAMARNSGYLKLRGRASYEFASASVAAALDVVDGKVRSVAIAIGGLGTVPWRDRGAEEVLKDRTLSPDAIDLYLDRLLASAEPRPETAHKIGLARGAVHHMLERLVAA